MWTSYWGPTETQWASHIFSIFKKNWKFNDKPSTDPQGKSLILVSGNLQPSNLPIDGNMVKVSPAV